METKERKETIDIIYPATCLLLAVSNADNIIEPVEIQIIKDIIGDFFKIEADTLDKTVTDCIQQLNQSTDLYEFGKILNNNFSYQDKVDFICCTFEVAFSDKSMHYMEEHVIKKIANILQVEHKDLIESKNEIKSYLS